MVPVMKKLMEVYLRVCFYKLSIKILSNKMFIFTFIKALQHFSSLSKGGDQEARYKVIRDFIALNKAAAKSGCINAKENDDYRYFDTLFNLFIFCLLNVIIFNILEHYTT